MNNHRNAAPILCLILLVALLLGLVVPLTPISANLPDEAIPRFDHEPGAGLSRVSAVTAAGSGWFQHDAKSGGVLINDLATDTDGNLYTIGKREEPGSGGWDWDIVTIQYDSSGERTWYRLLDTDEYAQGHGVAVSSATSSVYVGGYVLGDLDGETSESWVAANLFVSKYDTNGNKEWTRLVGVEADDGGEPDYDMGLAADAAGNVYVAGHAHSLLTSFSRVASVYEAAMVAKYDSNGVRKWIEFVDAVSQPVVGTSVALDGDGNVYLAGHSSATVDGQAHAGGWDVLVSKFDKDGVKQWTRLLGTAQDEFGTGIGVDGSGGVYVGGHTEGDLDGQTNQGERDIFVAKYGADGTRQWVRLLGTAGFDSSKDLAVRAGGGAYVYGTSWAELAGFASASPTISPFVAQYAADGTRQWVDVLEPGGTYEAGGIDTGPGGGIYTGGTIAFDTRYPWLWKVGGSQQRTVAYNFDHGDSRNWFDDGSSTWGVTWIQDTALQGQAAYPAAPLANGAYQMTGNLDHAVRYSHFFQSISDFCLEVDARKVAGDSEQYKNAYGLRFRSDGSDDNFYAYFITASGQYWLGRRVAGEYGKFADWTPEPALNAGLNKWNRLGVCASGEQLKFYANGRLIKTVSDSSFAAGQVGVYAFDASDSDVPDTVQFDNVVLGGQPHMVYLPFVRK